MFKSLSIKPIISKTGSVKNVMLFSYFEEKKMKLSCPHCLSSKVKKNGNTHYGKQNHQCNDCKRQFVEGGQDWFISEEQKGLIDKLLKERISLAGICRVVEVSDVWLQSYLQSKYEELPDDLNTDLELPPKEEYLDNRFDEEIARLQKKKVKLQRNMNE